MEVELGVEVGVEVHYRRGWYWPQMKDAQVGGWALKCNREESVSSTNWCPVYCFYFRFLEKNEEQFAHQRDEEQNSLHLRKVLQNLAVTVTLYFSFFSIWGLVSLAYSGLTPLKCSKLVASLMLF